MSHTHTGTFVDVVGLNYKTNAAGGRTSQNGEFAYNPGDGIAFSIGNLLLGSCEGKPLITVSNLVSDHVSAFHPHLVNRARLLFSLTPGEGFEKKIEIDKNVEAVVEKHASEINLDSDDLSAIDVPLKKICDELGLRPKSVYHARNHLRRELAGFKVMRDFKIPSPSGGFVFADVYLPLQPSKKFPVLTSCTLYGRRVPWGGPDLENEQEVLAFERAEDHWHSTSSDTDVLIPDMGPWSQFFMRQRGFENLGTFNTFTYVPHGYAMVRIDPKGVSQTPGKRWVPGELASDFAAVIEWSAEQSWSNGSVAMVGSSGGANNQWAPAAMKPKGLKCFVPYATDIDMYREAAYIGGVPCTKYMENWFGRVQGISPKWEDAVDVRTLSATNVTYSKFWQMLEVDPKQSSEIPCFIAASQIFMIHGKGPFEVWMARRPENTHLQLVDSNYYAWPSQEAAAKILQFLDYHLKGGQCLEPERVGIQMRLGNQNWYWRKERSWPVPGTAYVNWYLAAGGVLSMKPPSDIPEVRLAYPAKPPVTGTSGVSFYSPPFAEDVEIAGHFTAVLNVSSTTPDADVNVFLWAVDETGRVVSYGASSSAPEPVAKGFLRVSHRSVDSARSLPYRTWHTHKEEDVALLQGADDVVEIAIELMPAAARIRKGWKLRVDVCPSEDQPDIPGYKAPAMRVWYGNDHEGTNAVHIGGNRANYIICPVVPTRDEYPNVML